MKISTEQNHKTENIKAYNLTLNQIGILRKADNYSNYIGRPVYRVGGYLIVFLDDGIAYFDSGWGDFEVEIPPTGFSITIET